MGKLVSYFIDHRRPVVLGLHVGLIVLANYSAFLLRFDGAIDHADLRLLYRALPALIFIRISVFGLFKLHEGLWRYAGIWDLSKIIQGCIAGTIVFAIVIRKVTIV